MNGPNSVGGKSPNPTALFTHASTVLATAADSLLKAAQTMGEAALALSQLSEAFAALNSSTAIAEHLNSAASRSGGKEGDEPLESPDGGSGYCGSEFGSSEVELYNDEDMVAAILASKADSPPDPSTTMPCCSGPMDISQIRFTPYVQDSSAAIKDGNEVNPLLTETGHVANIAASPEPSPAPVHNKPMPKPTVSKKLPAPGASAKTVPPCDLNDPTDKIGIKPSATKPRDCNNLNFTPSPAAPVGKKADFSVPGRYFIVLEEEFDTIPLILYLAEIHKKTICYVPSSESLLPYKQLLVSITNVTVSHGAPSIDFRGPSGALKTSALLLLALKSLGSTSLKKLTPDCLVYWGLIQDLKAFTQTPEYQAACSYMLLTTDEYSKASVREDLASYGIIEHPFQQLFSCYDEGSELSGLRKNTLTALEATRSSVYTQVLYYSFLNYHSIGPGRVTGITAENIVRRANRYAAKVLLRGDAEDGSKRFKPVGNRPHVTPGIITTCKLKAAKDMGLLRLKV